MQAVTFGAINDAIKRAGGKERLTHCGEIFAFTDGTTQHWAYRMVRVNSLETLTVEEWVQQWERLRSVYKAPTPFKHG